MDNRCYIFRLLPTIPLHFFDITLIRSMSTYQGSCGVECGTSAPVLPKLESQLSGGQRTSLVAEATIYYHQITTGKQQFASASDYLRHKKARIMAGTPICTSGRPPQSAIIAGLIATGCQACVVPSAGIITMSDSTTADPSYLGIYNQYFDISWTTFTGATSYSYSTDCPTEYVFVSTGPSSVRLYYVWNFTEPVTITITATNTCGSTSVSDSKPAPCFLAGSQVTLADKTTKSIEMIAVGDRILGAFGEINTVLALHRPLLGSATMCKINNDHSTSSHHPHISPDKRFFCMHPATVFNSTYGKEHNVIMADGRTEKRILLGLNPSRIETLAVGQLLKTVAGSRAVDTLEVFSMPPETQLYNLVVGGSHTYFVDGYAVTGWPREDDFNYDMWTPRV